MTGPALNADQISQAIDRRSSGRGAGRGTLFTLGPFGTAVTGLILLVFAVGLSVFAVIRYDQATRSAYTQSHGITRKAVVQDVRSTANCGRGTCITRSRVTVWLRHPVDGRRTATVSDPHRARLAFGQHTVVLVDPHEPSYAEFPGTPYKNTSDWVLTLLGAIIALGLAGIQLKRLIGQ